MSIAAMQWAKRQKTGDGTTKLVLLLLADYASPGPDDGPHPDSADGRHYTYAGIERVAADAEISTSTIKRHEQRLVGLGLIRKVRRFTRSGNRTSDYIVLPVDDDGARPWEAESTSGQSDLRSPVTPGPKLTGDPYIGTSSSEPPGSSGAAEAGTLSTVEAQSRAPGFPSPSVSSSSTPTKDELRADEEVLAAGPLGAGTLSTQLINDHGERLAVGRHTLVRLVRPPLDNGVKPYVIRRAVAKLIDRGEDLAPWKLQPELARIAADAGRRGPRHEIR